MRCGQVQRQYGGGRRATAMCDVICITVILVSISPDFKEL
jgi:hypothetical protein